MENHDEPLKPDVDAQVPLSRNEIDRQSQVWQHTPVISSREVDAGGPGRVQCHPCLHSEFGARVGHMRLGLEKTQALATATAGITIPEDHQGRNRTRKMKREGR